MNGWKSQQKLWEVNMCFPPSTEELHGIKIIFMQISKQVGRRLPE